MTRKSQKVEQFIEEIVELSKKYGFSLAHEDTQGAFIVENYSKRNIKWLQHAFDKTGEGNL